MPIHTWSIDTECFVCLYVWQRVGGKYFFIASVWAFVIKLESVSQRYQFIEWFYMVHIQDSTDMILTHEWSV